MPRPPPLPPMGGRGVRAWLFSLWQKDTTFFWRLSKDSLSKDRVPSDLYIEASPYSQSQGQPHVMASLGQSGQIVVKLMRVKVSNDRILIGLFGTAFDDSIGS